MADGAGYADDGEGGGGFIEGHADCEGGVTAKGGEAGEGRCVGEEVVARNG